MADVFISHSKRDRDLAKSLAQWLEGCDLSVWWDSKLLGGQRFRETIQTELEKATVVIVIWTVTSVKSQWVCDEADYASTHQKLIAVRSEQLPVEDIPLGFRGHHAALINDHDQILASVTHLVGNAGKVIAPTAPTRSSRPRPLLPTMGGLLILLLASVAIVWWRTAPTETQPGRLERKPLPKRQESPPTTQPAADFAQRESLPEGRESPTTVPAADIAERILKSLPQSREAEPDRKENIQRVVDQHLALLGPVSDTLLSYFDKLVNELKQRGVRVIRKEEKEQPVVIPGDKTPGWVLVREVEVMGSHIVIETAPVAINRAGKFANKGRVAVKIDGTHAFFVELDDGKVILWSEDAPELYGIKSVRQEANINDIAAMGSIQDQMKQGVERVIEYALVRADDSPTAGSGG